MKKKISIIDYGAGNLFSVLRGISRAGEYGNIVSSEKEIINSDYLILPGVGAFGDGISQLNNRGLFSPIKEFVKKGKPLLGICLGTQLLHSFGNEFGRFNGLDLIKGEVVKLPENENLPIPHVGWSKIQIDKTDKGSILINVQDNDYFYFTHSFSCIPINKKNELAKFNFGSSSLVAAVKNENVIGCQFHPELSSFAGIQILKNFLNL